MAASTTHAETGIAATPRVTGPGLPQRRLDSVDLVRGLVMVLMALDHVRDHLHLGAFFRDPTDLTTTTAPIFLTRWITHFCAPMFVFLAGTGAFLSGTRGRSKADLSRFLVTRGLWLIVLELTVIHVLWMMGWSLSSLFVQVIWALGWSMIVLAALVHLPIAATAAIGWGMIALHNLTDPVRPESLGAFAGLWTVLHVQGDIAWGSGRTFGVIYPLVPWIGVMAAGYAFGAWLLRPPAERRGRVMALGLVLTAAFVVLRALNGYGDPQPWSPQKDAAFTALSFLNTQKYPPSLLFLLMTIGPSLILLALVDRGVPRGLGWVAVFGRVPMFFYLAHLFLIDVMTVGAAIATYGPRTPEVFRNGPPPDWGFGLPVTYLGWAAVIVLLYPVCRWYAGVKARSRSRWMSYL